MVDPRLPIACHQMCLLVEVFKQLCQRVKTLGGSCTESEFGLYCFRIRQPTASQLEQLSA